MKQSWAQSFELAISEQISEYWCMWYTKKEDNEIKYLVKQTYMEIIKLFCLIYKYLKLYIFNVLSFNNIAIKLTIFDCDYSLIYQL